MVNFHRKAYFYTGDKEYNEWLISYSQSITGTASNKNFIISELENIIDIFINDFHKANDF